ncbi:AEC family transporter [Pararhizobium haloflavum]|uniref:AEC family transporter n=1 Tax=Pararhizobium haloflavum TaxID=2037914 RepID=UPI000C17A5D0|nr:AEC family transporter [Pararhizobium haloflavum]
MPPFVETILFVFLLIVVGYGAAAAKILKPGTDEGLSDFVFTIAIPLLLFRTLINADFTGGPPWGLWIAYFTSVAVTWTAGHLIIRKGYGRDARAGVVAGVTSAFSNLVLVGLPLVSGMFGDEGLLTLSLIISVHLAIMLATSMVLFEWALHRDGVTASGERRGPRAMLGNFVRQFLTNPLVIGILCGLAGRLIGKPLPPLATRLVDTVASVAGPLALVAMGMSLRKFGLHGHLVPALTLSAVKLVLMPAVALVMALIIGLPPVPAQVAVIAASLPAGVNAWLIASRFNTGQRLASTAMTLATGMAVVTTLAWALIAAAVFA